MALVTLQFRSSALMKNVSIHLVVPECGMARESLSCCRVVYLLHGLSEDASSWIRKTNAERYALERGLVLVMPSADRSMYCDGILGQDYFSHITEELPTYLQKLFGLSRSREQNAILGFSMGGYGAARAALSYPERYVAWGSLSGPLDLAPLLPHLDEGSRRAFPFLLAHADRLESTPYNPVNLIDAGRQARLKGYIACGTEDDLLPCSRRFQLRSEQAGLPNRFLYPAGQRHDWAFCDSQLPAFFAFLEEV